MGDPRCPSETMVDDPNAEDEPERALTRRQGRRRFIAGVVAGAGATAIPHWLSHTFGLGSHALHPHGVGAWLGPEEAPRRVLVLVIPDHPRARWNRGYAFGAWLNHGTAQQLSWLAFADVCCEQLGDLPALGVEVEGDPWMVLIEPAVGRVTPIVPASVDDLEDVVPVELPPDLETGEPSEDRELEASLAEIDALARGLANAMEPELERWAQEERAALGCQDIDAFDEMVRVGGWPWTKHIRDAPAALVLGARRDDAALSEALVIEALAERVRTQYVRREIPGSRWGRGSGCGTQIEGEAPRYFGCGMGHVPELSRRFLHFFADGEV